MAVSEVDRRLVAGVVALAHSLGVEVVAEGVELEEQVVALRELGCRSAQGFVYSPAVPCTILLPCAAAIRRADRQRRSPAARRPVSALRSAGGEQLSHRVA